MVGPDHRASATPEELKMIVDSVRKAEIMLGDKVKKVTLSEKKNKRIARKSIVAKQFIEKGEKFTLNNITCKRPGNGISPMYWYDVLGKYAESDFKDEICYVYDFEGDEK